MISNKDIQYYNAACILSQESECRYKFAALIVKGKKISTGVNKRKTHPVFKRYGSYIISIHAEVAAVLKARFDVQGSTMYIARDSVNPQSRPCKVCMAILIESGIRRIVYHNGRTLQEEYL